MSSRLQLKREDEDGDASTCPSCGADMAADAVVCVACGYDKRSGRRVDDVPAPRNNPIVLALLGVVIVAALGIVVYRAMSKPGSPPEASVQAPPAAPAPAVPPAAETPPSTAAAPVASVTVAPETNVASSADEPRPSVDEDALAAEQRSWAEAQVNRVAPPFALGEQVELRLTNGIVQRGVFRGLAADTLKIEVAAQDVRSLPLVALDRGTRVRADADFRARYIEFRARQRASELLKAREASP